jgi:hypothetical protein
VELATESEDEGMMDLFWLVKGMMEAPGDTHADP